MLTRATRSPSARSTWPSATATASCCAGPTARASPPCWPRCWGTLAPARGVRARRADRRDRAARPGPRRAGRRRAAQRSVSGADRPRRVRRAHRAGGLRPGRRPGVAAARRRCRPASARAPSWRSWPTAVRRACCSTSRPTTSTSRRWSCWSARCAAGRARSSWPPTTSRLRDALAGSRRRSRSSPPAMGPTKTATPAWCRTCWLTEPNIEPIRPSPRAPRMTASWLPA